MSLMTTVWVDGHFTDAQSFGDVRGVLKAETPVREPAMA